MDRMQAETVTVEPATVAGHPVWQKPEMIQVAIDDVTGCCISVPPYSDASGLANAPS